MTAKHSLMAVHAHPDDEVFSTGGILAKYSRAGDDVVVVYCTRGEAGEIHDPDLDAEEARPRLGEIRERELQQSLDILGVRDYRFLGYRDSGMVDTEDNQNAEAFMNAPLDDAVERLIEIMRETRPQVVVTYDEDGHYGHPDHIMANRVTVEAFRRTSAEPWGPEKLYYAAGSREAFRREVDVLASHGITIPWLSEDFNFDDYGLPESQITAVIDVSRYVPLKQRALAAHRTQIPADFYYLALPSDVLSAAAGREYFLRIEPPSGPDEHEADLFVGVPERDREADVASRAG